MLIHKPSPRGDTLIEVMFAVAIFGLVAIGTISLMNKGLATTQNSLEVTMARQEIDAQAEALRFLHSAYLSEPKKSDVTPIEDVCRTPNSYRDLWKCITSKAYPPTGSQAVTAEDPEFYTRIAHTGETCDDLFRTTSNAAFSTPSKSFVINPRSLDISDLTSVDDISYVLKRVIIKNDQFSLAGTYPRLIYDDAVDGDPLSDATVNGQQITYGSNKKTLHSAEGIWVTAITSPSGVQCDGEDGIRPDYYDFHIQTCWNAIASNTASTIKSTVRLFNPDQVSLTSKKNSITFANTNWNKWDNVCNQPECNRSDSYTNGQTHIDTSDPEGKKIILTGYGCEPANQGTYIDIQPSDTMTVSLNLAVSTFNGHPGGFFLVKLGPLSAVLSSDHMDKIYFANDSRTVQELPTGSPLGFNFSREVGISGYSNVTIILEKTGTHYKGYLDGKEDEFFEFDNDQGIGLQLAFWMSHNDHCCDIVYRATATVDITLPALPDEDNGCYRVSTPISDENSL